MIDRRTVICLGVSQLVSWGVTYYLIGGFGDSIANELGWSRDGVYGGFALAILVMGLVSPAVGRAIERHGGRPVMAAGSLLNAAGCVGLACCNGRALYFAAWVVLGLGMRLTLYDAAFAALARIGGPFARRPMAQITLLGGLASTVFWPFGYWLTARYGWRHPLDVYALAALLTLPLHLSLPRGRHDDVAVRHAAPAPVPRAAGDRSVAVAGSLYAFIATAVNFLNAGMSAHMIGLLGGLGLAATAAVGVSALRGIGQSCARLCEVLFGRSIDPLTLNSIACLLMPAAFLVGLQGGRSAVAAGVFAFLYGACNGILTITRGTLPLVLFDPRTYGSFVGKLIAPSFVFSAAAPMAYAALVDRLGAAAGLWMSLACAVLMLTAALCLQWMHGRHRERRRAASG